MKAVIMAGGRGERLRPFTYVLPKPLLPVNDTNSIENSIKNLKNCGIKDFLISVNYMKEKFSICQRYEKKHDVNILLFEEKQRMGTAGSLKLMQSELDQPFLMLNGDLFADVDYTEMQAKFMEHSCDCLVGVKKIETQSLYGVVDIRKDLALERMTEKPTKAEWINSGIYILKPEIIQMIQETFTDITDLLQRLISQNKSVYTFDIGERWIDIGKIEDYKKAEKTIKAWH